MKRYTIEAEPDVEFDVETAFDWYEAEERGLGLEFLEQLRATYLSNSRESAWISGTLIRYSARYDATVPYAVYFSIEGDVILVLAVLHTARDPAEWQRRI